jgi:adenylyltransferase/sulfurtransferase
MLTTHELEKFKQHTMLKAVGVDGQSTLKASKVLCIGCGGLGSPVCLYLANAGVGTIGIIDGDRIELSNLPRQILYTEEDIGQYKSEVCQKKLQQINLSATFKTYPSYLTADNAIDIISDYDVIIDCSDNFATRYLISDVCCRLNKVNISAGIYQFNGLCAVFPGAKGPCYRCLFESMDSAQQNCDEMGVLNTLAGLIALIQAHEAIKFILGMSELINGKVLLIDGLSMTIKKITLENNSDCITCGDHQSQIVSLDQLPRPVCLKKLNHNNIDYYRFLKMKSADKKWLLIDVRLPEEYQQYHLQESINIPLSELEHYLKTIDKEITLFLYCQTGGRSRQGCEIAKKNSHSLIYNIVGGLDAI